MTINQDGWRSAEIARAKPDDVFRIVVLGDSFMAAVQVADDETFAAVLEDRLAAAGLPKRVEVINLGVPAYANDQEYLALREYGLAYDPDLVLLAFYSQNDVKGNDRVLDRRDVVYPKPFFDLENGQLVELPFDDPTPSWIRILRRMAEPIRIYPWLRDRLVRIPLTSWILYELGITGIVPSAATAEPATSQRFPGRWARQIAVFRTTDDDEWRHAWGITEALVSRIHQTAFDHDAGFLLVGLADPLTVAPASLHADELPFLADESLDFDRPSQILGDLARASGFDFVSLIPAFRTAIDDRVDVFEALYLSCDGHWTAAGHKLAADVVAEQLVPVITQRLAP